MAEQLLTRDCMSRRGFRYWPEPFDPAADLKRFPYVVDDIRWARVHGYSRDVVQRLDAAAASNPNQAHFNSLSEQQRASARTALHGENRGQGLEARPPMGGTLRHSATGCTAEAWRRLYKDIRSWYRASQVISNLDGLRVGMVQQDARYRAKIQSWRECMEARNISANNPNELRTNTLAYQGPDATERDRHVAVNEAACAKSSRLADTANELDRIYDAALRRQYKSDYETVERLKQVALPTAREIVRQG